MLLEGFDLIDQIRKDFKQIIKILKDILETISIVPPFSVFFFFLMFMPYWNGTT